MAIVVDEATKNLSHERVKDIKLILAKLQRGFEATKSDWAPFDELGLSHEEWRELKPYAHHSYSENKQIIFAKSVTKWLQKTGALESPIFLAGVSTGGGVVSREKKGAFAGATPAEIRAGGSPIHEPERPFEGGFVGPATHLRPMSRERAAALRGPWKHESFDDETILMKLEKLFG